MLLSAYDAVLFDLTADGRDIARRGLRGKPARHAGHAELGAAGADLVVADLGELVP